MERSWTLADLLGVPEGAEDQCGAALSTLTRKAFGHDADPAAARVRQVGYSFGSPATAALLRVEGPEGVGWSLFCKVLQSARHWPLLPMLPEAVREEFARDFPWRSELALWDDVIQATFPPGVRSPVRYDLVDLGDDRLVVWMEDVAEDPGPWDLERFARAARALGRWNARSRDGEVLASCGYPVGFALRMYAEDAVAHRGLGPLTSDEVWQHPWLAPHGELRSRLLDVATRIPELLDRLDALEQCLPHGDASPQNLLVPVDDPDGFVAIDISFRAPHALGFDLSQLLVGLVHASLLPAAEMAEVADTILPAYVEGLRAEGWHGEPADVRFGFAVSTLLRSGFDGFRYDLLDRPVDDHEARAEFEQRVELARFVLDRARRVL